MRLGVVRALDDAAGDELGDGRSTPPSSASASGASQIASAVDRPAAEPALGRRADPHDRLAIELRRRRPRRRSATRPAGELARPPPAPSRSACRVSSPNAARRLQLAAGPPVELAERARRTPARRRSGSTRTSVATSHGWSLTTRTSHGCRVLRMRTRRRVRAVRTGRCGIVARQCTQRPVGRVGRAPRERRRLVDGRRAHRPVLPCASSMAITRAVHPALADVGHDDHETAGVGWQTRPRPPSPASIAALRILGDLLPDRSASAL